jgi:hypothetical protein
MRDLALGTVDALTRGGLACVDANGRAARVGACEAGDWFAFDGARRGVTCADASGRAAPVAACQPGDWSVTCAEVHVKGTAARVGGGESRGGARKSGIAAR